MLRSVLDRIRVPALVIGLALACTSPLHHQVFLAGFGGLLILTGVAATLVPSRRVEREPTTVDPPVRGRWIALNSPADKIPSHGVHSAAQTYAIDLLYWPDADEEWTGLRQRPLVQPPTAFPGFGQPVYAPADGTVVHVRDWWRDHWSRKSWPAFAYFFLEGTARELVGALMGNHVILDLGDGTYAALAHLKRKSIVVEKGQKVSAGQQLASCGNSGNTTEPHLHFQLMDAARPAVAAGLPFRFDGSPTPKNGEPLLSQDAD